MKHGKAEEDWNEFGQAGSIGYITQLSGQRRTKKKHPLGFYVPATKPVKKRKRKPTSPIPPG